MNSFSNKLVKYGVDPTSKKFKKYYNKDIKVIPSIFNSKIFKKNTTKFKFISSIAMFYDLADPILFCDDVSKISSGWYISCRNCLFTRYFK